MAQSTILEDGASVTKAPVEQLPYRFDFDPLLPADAILNTYAVSLVAGSDGVLAVDSVALATGSRKVDFRVKAGTSGKTYTLECVVTSNENPTRTKRATLIVKVI